MYDWNLLKRCQHNFFGNLKTLASNLDNWTFACRNRLCESIFKDPTSKSAYWHIWYYYYPHLSYSLYIWFFSLMQISVIWLQNHWDLNICLEISCHHFFQFCSKYNFWPLLLAWMFVLWKYIEFLNFKEFISGTHRIHNEIYWK